MKHYCGPALYHFRTMLGVSQLWLAKHLTMSRQNLSAIERNQQKISEKRLAIAAEKLQTTIQEIKCFEGKDNVPFNGDPVPSAERPELMTSLLYALQTAQKATQQAQLCIADLEAALNTERESRLDF